MNIYEAKVKTMGQDKKGNPKILTCSYLVSKNTFSEVEEELMKFAMSISSISLSKADTIIGGDDWDEESDIYKGIVVLQELAEDGSVKESKLQVFAWAHTTEEANNVVKEWMSENMYVYSISKTNFIDIL